MTEHNQSKTENNKSSKLSLPESVLQLVKDKNSRELFSEYAEVVFDAISDSEILDTIPLVNTLTKGGKAILSVRDRLFINKLEALLKQIDDVDDTDKEKFLLQIESEGKSEEFPKQLLALIERLESEEKAKIIGALFKDYIKGTIPYENFHLLCTVVDNTYIMDIHLLRQIYQDIDKTTFNHLTAVFSPYRVIEVELFIAKYNESDILWTGKKEDQVRERRKLSPWGLQLVNTLNRLYKKD